MARKLVLFFVVFAGMMLALVFMGGTLDFLSTLIVVTHEVRLLLFLIAGLFEFFWLGVLYAFLFLGVSGGSSGSNK